MVIRQLVFCYKSITGYTEVTQALYYFVTAKIVYPTETGSETSNNIDPSAPRPQSYLGLKVNQSG